MKFIAERNRRGEVLEGGVGKGFMWKDEGVEGAEDQND